MTAQRRDEAASLRFGHILDGTWRQATNKSDRPQASRCRHSPSHWWGEGGAQDYVFAGRSGKLSGFSKLKAELDKASGVTDWRLHDLRRTAATNMQELGIRNEVVQSILNQRARCWRRLPALRTRKAEGRGAGDMGHTLLQDRQADAGDRMREKKKFTDDDRLREIGKRLAIKNAESLVLFYWKVEGPRHQSFCDRERAGRAMEFN